MKSQSGSSTPSNQDRLRKQFTSWSLAVLSTMVGTATVHLDSSAAWGQDEPARAKDGDKEETLSREGFIKLLQASKFDEAADALDAARKKNPDDFQYIGMESNLISMAQRVQPEKMKVRAERLAGELESKLTQGAQFASIYANLSQVRAIGAANSGKLDDAIKILGGSLAKLKEANISANPSSSNLETLRIQMLVSAGRAEEAKGDLDKQMDALLASAKDNQQGLLQLASMMSLYGRAFGEQFAEEVAAREKKVEALIVGFADQDDSKLANFLPLRSLRSAQAQQLTYTDAKKAEQYLLEVKGRGEKLAEKLEGSELQQLQQSLSQLNSSLKSLESALAREALIGQKAIEFDVQSFVGMEPTTLAALKGKVVLLDFWAVWCGPCIATFPHLRQWQEEYGDKGLVIVGVTREYGYRWVAYAEKAMKAEGTTTEEEMAMLGEFRKHHQLGHGFLVTPKDSDYSKSFAVSGIPQAVIIDQEGVIRMIRVGSGEPNAKALEKMIKELLNKSASSS